MKLDMQVIQDFENFSKQALWGSKKSLVALEFLEKYKGWWKGMACKTFDLVGFLGTTYVASESLLLELWNRNVKYKYKSCEKISGR